MEDINGKILYQGYGLKLLNTTRSRGGFVCKTDKGYKELKKKNTQENLLLFESEAKDHLSLHGFQNLNKFNKTIEEKPFYFFEGNHYTVEDYIPTQSADLTSKQTILEATSTLARMHQASKGFHSEIQITNIGHLPILYEKRIQELNRIKKWIANQSCLSKIDLIVLKNYAYFKEKAEQSLDLLHSSKYNELMEQAIKDNSFCHNAYKGDNIRVLESGALFVSGFQKCAYDYCMIDLAEFIRRYMKNEDCQPEIIASILEAYDQVHSVTPADKELIFAMLSYPYKFLKLCNEYYNKRRVYVSDAIVQKMENCVAQSERNNQIIQTLQQKI